MYRLLTLNYQNDTINCQEGYKLKVKFVFLFIILILIFSFSNAFADKFFSDLVFEENNLFTTVISYTDGNEMSFSGIIDTESIEKSEFADSISSYSVYKSGKCLISVNLFDIKNTADASVFESSTPLNGYYSTRFTLSEEDNTEVYLTGLTPENMKKIQTALLNSVIENSSFSFDDVDFIDAEKESAGENNDSLMCWSATSSNILHYTGWGAKASASFKTSDDIFENFIANFTDQAGNSIYAFEWFFNGSYNPQTWNGWSHAKNFGNSGAYLKKYASSSVSKYVFEKSLIKFFPYDFSLLEEGYGFSVSVGWLNSYGTRTGGHVISGWGYICDKDYVYDNPLYFKALIVSDSDNDRYSTSDRRQAPNTLTVLNMTPYYENEYSAWSFDGYGGVFEGYQLLAPYSDNTPSEADLSAKLDKINYPDLTPRETEILLDGNLQERIYKKYYSGSKLSFQIGIENKGNVSYIGNVRPHLTIKNNLSGKTVYNDVYNSSETVNRYSYGYFGKCHAPGVLPAGKYTVQTKLNEQKAVSEAYYYNNTYEQDFEIINKPSNYTSSPFTASIGKFKGDNATVTFSYGDFEKNVSSPEAYTRIYKSIYKNSEWSPWEEIEYEDNGIFRKKYSLPADGEKVKFMYTFHMDKDTIPLSKESPEYNLSYSVLSLDATEYNAASPTPVLYSNQKLTESEKFEFYVRSTCVGDTEPVEYDVFLYALQNNVKTYLYKKEGNIISQGDEDHIFSISAWDTPLSGRYEIHAEISGDFGVKSIALSSLTVSEKPAFHVNLTTDTKNAFDNKISFSEAIEYIKEFGTTEDKITLENGISITNINPNIITNEMTIEGNGAAVSLSLRAFQINEGGVLNLKNITLNSGNCDKGIINVNSGIANLENVSFINNTSTFGASIYSKSGTVNLKNCIFKFSNSFRGIIYAEEASKINMLHCIFAGNKSKDIVYAGNSDINIINSTFVNNTINGESSVYAAGTSRINIFSSILTNNDAEPECFGNVYLYGCYVTDYDEGVSADLYTQKASIHSLFLCDTRGNALQNSFSSYKMSPLVKQGIILKNDAGSISYSKDNKIWVKTDIPSPFTDAEYCRDIFGNVHNGILGTENKWVDSPCIIEKKNGKCAVYLPEDTTVTFIEKYNYNAESLADIKVKTLKMSVGTNYADLSFSPTLGTHKCFLWDGAKKLIPLIK